MYKYELEYQETIIVDWHKLPVALLVRIVTTAICFDDLVFDADAAGAYSLVSALVEYGKYDPLVILIRCCVQGRPGVAECVLSRRLTAPGSHLMSDLGWLLELACIRGHRAVSKVILRHAEFHGRIPLNEAIASSLLYGSLSCMQLLLTNWQCDYVPEPPEGCSRKAARLLHKHRQLGCHRQQRNRHF